MLYKIYCFIFVEIKVENDMAQPTLSVNVITISGINERMFIPFFNIDSDFGENEDYWEQTNVPKGDGYMTVVEQLGLENESERSSKIMYEKFRAKFPTPEGEEDNGGLWIIDDDHFTTAMEEILEECAHYSIPSGEDNNCSTQFILGNSTYTRQYEITCIFNDNYNGIEYDGDTTVVISYMG